MRVNGHMGNNMEKENITSTEMQGLVYGKKEGDSNGLTEIMMKIKLQAN